MFKWVIARIQPNGIRDKREDALQNSAITISWQGNDVAVSATDDSQAPVNIGADCGYRSRLRSDPQLFEARLTPPPPRATRPTFAIRPVNKTHTRRILMEIDMTRPVVFASDCTPCSECGEPVCPVCDDHYAECACPGPHSEAED